MEYDEAFIREKEAYIRDQLEKRLKSDYGDANLRQKESELRAQLER